MAAPYERDGVLVVPISGEFDVSNAGDLERHLTERSSEGLPLILDFSETGYIDSSVLAVLIRRKKALGKNVGFVVPPNSNLQLIFDVSGLHDVLALSGSVDEALKKSRET